MTTLDGVDLTSAGRWSLNADTRLRVPPAVVISDVSIPGMHGVLPALTAPYSPGSVVLGFDVEGTDYADMLANYSALSAALGAQRRLRVLADGEYRASVQYVSASDLSLVAEGLFGQVTYTFSIPSGFWQDADPATLSLASGANSPAELQGGSAPIVDALFLVASGVTITDDVSETWFTWEGSGTVRVNPARQTAYSGGGWTGGSNVSGGLVLGPGQFQLSPGIAFTVAGGSASVRARRAYL